jgi:hypothetical protein
MMQTHGRTAVTLTALALFATSAAAQSGGTLTDGAAVYVQQPAPSGESLASPTGAVFEPEGVSPNQLFQNWWYYRTEVDSREYPFGTYLRSAGGQISGTSNYSGHTATYNWTDSAVGGATRFTALYTTTLTHGAQTGTATLTQTMQITNPGPSVLDMVLFNYADIDANGSPSGSNPNGTNRATGGLSGITVTDGPWSVVHSAVGASHYQVSGYSDIRDSLLDANLNNLTDTGLPFGPNDYTGAFEWSLSIPAGQSATVTSTIAVSPVPEPGSLLMTAAVSAAAIGLRRRRRSVRSC